MSRERAVQLRQAGKSFETEREALQEKNDEDSQKGAGRMSKSVVYSHIFSSLAQEKMVAARAGEFLFLAGQTPHDPETGRLVTGLQDIKLRAKGILDIDEYGSLFDRVISGPMAAQAFTILANIKDILSENGMSMEQIVKSNIYITNFQDLGVFYRIWKKFFPKPTTACTVFGISRVGINPKIRVTMDCIAALPEKIPLGKIERFPSDRPEIGLGGCAAVKAGDLIFISGHVGINSQGRAILKCREVSKEAQAFIESVPMATARAEASVAQFWSINKQIGDLLRRIGSSGENILAFHTFARTMTHELYSTQPVRNIFYPEQPPTGTSFGCPSILGNEDLCLQIEAIATVPGKKEAFRFETGLTKPTAHYSMVTKAGQYAFLSGRAGINWQSNGDPIVFPNDLAPWDGQHIMVGRLEQEKPAFLQAWHVYEETKRIIEQIGATLDDVVKTGIFLTDLSDFPLVERARNYFFKETPPVETVVPVSQITMHPELVLEMEPFLVMESTNRLTSIKKDCKD